jgi:hypothetical protein
MAHKTPLTQSSQNLTLPSCSVLGFLMLGNKTSEYELPITSIGRTGEA